MTKPIAISRFMNEHPLGYVHEESDATVFFGGKGSDILALRNAFPDFEFMVLKQTHSDIIVRSPFDDPPEADAHFTRKRRVALCIRTADCMPVLIHEPSSGLIAAAHAGWRGIENEIIRKTGARLASDGAHLERARAWIGPHIGMKSFEVGKDVGAKLEFRFDAVWGESPDATALHPHDDPEKCRVDLLTIARAQLQSVGIGSERIIELPIDTFTSEMHESFRRDGAQAGRQISFIALK